MLGGGSLGPSQGGPATSCLLVLVASFAVALPLVVSRAVYQGYGLPRFALLIAAAPLAAGLLCDLALTRRFGRIDRLFPALLALQFGAIALSTLLHSNDLMSSALGSYEVRMGLVTYAAVWTFALAAQVSAAGSERRRVWLLRALAAAGLAILCMGPDRQAGDEWRWTGAFGHANYTANVILIPFFISAGLALGAPRRAEAVFWGVGAALMSLELVLLQTRGAWLGALAGSAVIALLFLRGPLRVQGPAMRRLLLPTAVAGALALSVLAVLLAVPAIREAAGGRLADVLRVDAGSSVRLQAWKSSIPFFRDHGLSGVGAEGFRDSFIPYKTEELGRALGDGQFRDIHSQPLQLLAEGGIAALAASVGLVLLAGLRVLRRLRDPMEDRRARWRAAGLLAALLAHAVHCLTISHVPSSSFFWHVALGAATAMGAPWTHSKPPEASPKRAPPYLRLLAAAAALALTLATGLYAARLLQADTAILLCRAYGERRADGKGPIDSGAALREGRRAVELAPEIGSYHQVLAKTIADALAGSGGSLPEARRADLFDEGFRHADEAVRRGGNRESFPLTQAFLFYLAGRSAEAEAAVRASIAADPHFWGSRRLLGMILLEQGRKEEARREAEILRRLAPDRPETQRLWKLIEEGR